MNVNTANLSASSSPNHRPPACRVSVIIKTLNEEKRIAATIESALAALASVGGEVVVADSCSTDNTVAIAQTYPIRVVQLLHPEERCCGIGPQLGYQHCQGEFVYILDGDMKLKPGFLETAIGFIDSHPRVAGVAGRLVEQNLHSLEYMARAQKTDKPMHAKCVDKLDGGGLYQRAAIEDAGYFSNRNLHSYEELDLAVRLRAKKWQLWRLPVDAVDHFGHDAPPYQLLIRRWKTGYICGLGELMRAAIGQPSFKLMLQSLRELRIYLGVMAWWALLVSSMFWPLSVPLRMASFAGLLFLPVLVMSWRKKSLPQAVYAVVSWCFHAAGLIRGVLAKQRPATERIASRVIREPLSPYPQAQGVSS